MVLLIDIEIVLALSVIHCFNPELFTSQRLWQCCSLSVFDLLLLMNLSFWWRVSIAISDIKNANQTCPYFCYENRREFAYRYTEYNSLDTSEAYPYMTYRNVRASAGHYYQYDVDWANLLLHEEVYKATSVVVKKDWRRMRLFGFSECVMKKLY